MKIGMNGQSGIVDKMILSDFGFMGARAHEIAREARFYSKNGNFWAPIAFLKGHL